MVPGIGRARELLPDLAPEVVHEPQLGAAVGARLHRLLAPLQETLGVGEGAGFLDVASGRHEEDLSPYPFGLELAGLYFGRVVPEGGGLYLLEVAYDEPVEVGEGEARELAVGAAHGRALAHHEESPAPAVDHAMIVG
jgi:hypothetical protein